MAAKFGDRYEVIALVGKGGMGEVYRAHDKRLRRDVALKVLPEALSRDPQRVALFQREAQVIAALNHPNIAAIHELEENGGVRWLVLELVPGETLEDRLKRGPLSIREALSIAQQVCDALEAAHDKGIIHRDLKPSNIKITPDEKVKLLDFGLASAFELNPRTTDLGETPTLPTPDSIPSHAGTAAYMSPEQFQWKIINKQVDVWAFGCLLYEMLTGKCAFLADTLRETATLILETEPEWRPLNSLPPQLLNLIRRCLQKDRRLRLHDIADARIEIDYLLGDKDALQDRAPNLGTKDSHRRWALPGIFFVCGFLVAFALWQGGRAPRHFPPVRFSIPVLQTNSITQISISPDGQKIAYVAGNEQGLRILWIREIASASATPVPGVEGPGGLFWAPDNEHLAFLRQEQLSVVDVRDGSIERLAAAPGSTSGSWSQSGDILIDSSEGGGLFRISASGGNRTRITSPDRSSGERHFQPQFLPDGRQFVFLGKTNQPNTTGIYLGSLDSNVHHFLTSASSKALFSAPSDIYFVRDGTLFRQALLMNPLQLAGEAIRVADHVSSSAIGGSAAFSVSLNGVLAYRAGSAFQNAKLQWFDRRGNELAATAEPAIYTQIALSPDDKYIATERRDPDTGSYDIWLADAAKNTNTRVTFDDSSERNPIWLPDSQHLIFSSDKSGAALLRIGIDSIVNPELVLKSDETYRPMDITRNGILIFRDGGRTFYTLSLDGQQQPQRLLQSDFRKSGGHLSPNGKWLAFDSTDSGRDEIYVVPFPKADRRLQISINGGVQPLWNAAGTEMFYLDLAGRVMAVTIDSTQAFVSGVPKVLFNSGLTPTAGLSQYAVNSNGMRFLAIPPVTEQQPSSIDVTVDWSAVRP